MSILSLGKWLQISELLLLFYFTWNKVAKDEREGRDVSNTLRFAEARSLIKQRNAFLITAASLISIMHWSLTIYMEGKHKKWESPLCSPITFHAYQVEWSKNLHQKINKCQSTNLVDLVSQLNHCVNKLSLKTAHTVATALRPAC